MCYNQKTQGIAAPSSDQGAVVVHYRQALFNGEPIDNSYEHGGLSDFPAGTTTPGFVAALKLMKAIGKFKFCIPPSPAFSIRGAETMIPLHSVLVPDVELLYVKRAK
ncbi:MAG: FKBP-type peptidyl-prolyl cis-trans isomerase [Pseudomonadota bacterium]